MISSLSYRQKKAVEDAKNTQKQQNRLAEELAECRINVWADVKIESFAG